MFGYGVLCSTILLQGATVLGVDDRQACNLLDLPARSAYNGSQADLQPVKPSASASRSDPGARPGSSFSLASVYSGVTFRMAFYERAPCNAF